MTNTKNNKKTEYYYVIKGMVYCKGQAVSAKNIADRLNNKIDKIKQLEEKIKEYLKHQ